MLKQTLGVTVTTVIALFLSSTAFCADADPAQAQPEPLTRKKIALMAVADPEEVIVENRGGPLSLLALPGFFTMKAIADKRGADLVVVLRKNAVQPGNEMTAALVEQLTLEGYSVDLIKDGVRVEDNPNEIDLEKIVTDAESVLVVKFDGFGLFSGFRTTNFLPRVNMDYEILKKKDLSTLYSQSIDYGADAPKANEEEIPSDPKYAYPSFEDAINRQTEVIESFRVGFHQIAAQLAKQLSKHGI